MVETALTQDPQLDVLIGNAGEDNRTDVILEDPFSGDDDAWADVFALNLNAAVRDPPCATTAGSLSTCTTRASLNDETSHAFSAQEGRRTG